MVESRQTVEQQRDFAEYLDEFAKIADKCNDEELVRYLNSMIKMVSKIQMQEARLLTDWNIDKEKVKVEAERISLRKLEISRLAVGCNKTIEHYMTNKEFEIDELVDCLRDIALHCEDMWNRKKITVEKVVAEKKKAEDETAAYKQLVKNTLAAEKPEGLSRWAKEDAQMMVTRAMKPKTIEEAALIQETVEETLGGWDKELGFKAATPEEEDMEDEVDD